MITTLEIAIESVEEENSQCQWENVEDFFKHSSLMKMIISELLFESKLQ